MVTGRGIVPVIGMVMEHDTIQESNIGWKKSSFEITWKTEATHHFLLAEIAAEITVGKRRRSKLPTNGDLDATESHLFCTRDQSFFVCNGVGNSETNVNHHRLGQTCFSSQRKRRGETGPIRSGRVGSDPKHARAGQRA
ncbi:hypothetical protein NL676_006814 [Syzygium grande]|nr:hypothetical protein NL676_006814 [Syzygium grande]